ncbi:hypothetical protein [Gluconobacter sphaericus]|uniref:Uncharacterized protein n=1 Tax=Gluconobacter sphaericus NBRC 12467 TaxID=1307951 RepID=A0AA37WAH1_9PROT|nr:hypothetical protein [Gluconobacter sphaericus]MBF0884406.1 hypothetical protein [Gluconobacter sphaericus]GBR53117.1 hypothetical protein AA12467_1229 [Gluconobacter sphaericus NBRC 12467]GEB41581.1 hypothetical protein GSP01_03630 [Gluconobacter sphaericus NBRC 12467]GLQ83693.1 hypothetical protein GCM10007872_06010 [Gluconobacter sphaericus NBRC 12467]
MSHLTQEERNALPDSAFGLTEKRAYPIDTRARARNAKARATQEYKRGLLTMEERDRIDQAADQRLARDD